MGTIVLMRGHCRSGERPRSCSRGSYDNSSPIVARHRINCQPPHIGISTVCSFPLLYVFLFHCLDLPSSSVHASLCFKINPCRERDSERATVTAPDLQPIDSHQTAARPLGILNQKHTEDPFYFSSLRRLDLQATPFSVRNFMMSTLIHDIPFEQPAGPGKARLDMEALLYAYWTESDEGTTTPKSPFQPAHEQRDAQNLDGNPSQVRKSLSSGHIQDEQKRSGSNSRKSARLAGKRGRGADSDATFVQMQDQPCLKKRKIARKPIPEKDVSVASPNGTFQLPEELSDKLLRRPTPQQLQRAMQVTCSLRRKRQTKFKLSNNQKTSRTPSPPTPRKFELRKHITRSASKSSVDDSKDEAPPIADHHIQPRISDAIESVAQEEVNNDVSIHGASEAQESGDTSVCAASGSTVKCLSNSMIPDRTSSITRPRDDVFECGNPHCKTGQTTRGEFDRKAISHFFGRNKAVTKSIPAEVWFQLCRKCYQRDSYAARASPQAFVAWSVGLIESNLHRMAQWRPSAKWRVQLWVGARKRLNEWRKLRLQHRNAQEPDAEATKAMPPPPEVKRTSDQMSQAYMIKGFPLEHMEHFEETFEGDGKSYADLCDVLEWIRALSAAGQIPCLPPFEFLIQGPTDGEVISDPRTNVRTAVAPTGGEHTIDFEEVEMQEHDLHINTEEAETMVSKSRPRFRLTAAGRAFGLLGGSTFGACPGSGISV